MDKIIPLETRDSILARFPVLSCPKGFKENDAPPRSKYRRQHVRSCSTSFRFSSHMILSPCPVLLTPLKVLPFPLDSIPARILAKHYETPDLLQQAVSCVFFRTTAFHDALDLSYSRSSFRQGQPRGYVETPNSTRGAQRRAWRRSTPTAWPSRLRRTKSSPSGSARPKKTLPVWVSHGRGHRIWADRRVGRGKPSECVEYR